MRYAQIQQRRAQAAPPSGRPASVRLLVRAAHALGTRSTPLLALSVLDALPGYVRHVVLGLVDRHFPDGDLSPRPGADLPTHHDFVSLARAVDVVRDGPAGPALDAAYRRGAGGTSPLRRRAAADHARVRDLVERARTGAGGRGLRRDDVRYLLVLAGYVAELERMSFTGRVAPSFPADFYSDLGALAFDLYTRRPFERLLRRLQPRTLLDVGCGEGRHLGAAARALPGLRRAVGVERQPHVAESARRRVAAPPGVEVVEGTFGDEPVVETFDVALSSFMVFYLTAEQRARLYARVRDSLNPGGTFVLGQYFPDVEHMQEVLVRDRSPLPGLQLALCAVGNVLVRAEALLNRTLSDFASVAYWQETVDELAAAGLVVDEVLPADSMYYSWFVLARRAEDVRGTAAPVLEEVTA
ncbi:methyltransferase domain-containing protein [Cellulomonas sp.]|uniref:class I SAM-dependent methyltransferase n=1 Tax=Cellulomonas sp. TaxID=40001 RepID=UPI0028114BA9|nr:methyltransferase domain-containing protein [Cellulomonas sp.]